MNGKSIWKVATATAVLAALSAAVYAQDKFDKDSLKSPSGIAFADFRGDEDWAVLDVISTSEDRHDRQPRSQRGLESGY